jgi:hypothetical protein
MKVALCLSGQPRGLEKAYEYVSKNILDENDVDIFCHTWDDGDLVDKVYRPTHLGVTLSSQVKWDGEFRTRDPINHPARNTICFYYSLYCSDMFRKEYEIREGFRYDVVIRSRYDYAIARPLDFSTIDLTKIWTPLIKIPMPSGFLCTDQFAFSNSNNMGVYSDVYPNIGKYHETGTLVNGEDLLARHLRESQLADLVSYMDMWDPFMGGKYNYGPHSLIRDDMEEWRNK